MPKASPAPQLLPYQQKGVEFARSTQFRCLIADEPGLGKTAQALTCLKDAGLLPAVVIAPPSTILETWCREAARWVPQIPCAYLSDKKDDLPEKGWKGILIVPWSTLDHHSRGILRWKPRTVIVDEAHYAKEGTSERSAAIDELIEKAPYAILLTGTPIVNDTGELWRLLEGLKPGAWGKKSEFNQEAEEDPDLWKRKVDKVMIRRVFAEEMPELPPKTRHYQACSLPKKLQAEYKKADQDWQGWISSRLPILVAAEYRQRGIDPRAATAEIVAEVNRRAQRALDYEALVKGSHLRQLIGLAKVPLAADVALELLRAKEAVVLFAEHQPVVAALSDAFARAGRPFGVIEGKTSREERSELIRRFQESPYVWPLICTRAAYAGVTLTRARHVLFVERWWTSMEEDQGEGRIWRLGQKRPCHVVYFHVPGSIDDRLHQIVGRKRKQIQGLIGASDAIPGKGQEAVRKAEEES